MEDLHKNVTQLENLLKNEKRENAKELGALSSDLSKLHKKDDNIQVSADDATAHIASLEWKLESTTQLFETQAQINTNISNRLTQIEASDEANPRTIVANRETQTLNNDTALSPSAEHLPKGFHKKLVQAGYIQP